MRKLYLDWADCLNPPLPLKYLLLRYTSASEPSPKPKACIVLTCSLSSRSIQAQEIWGEWGTIQCQHISALSKIVRYLFSSYMCYVSMLVTKYQGIFCKTYIGAILTSWSAPFLSTCSTKMIESLSMSCSRKVWHSRVQPSVTSSIGARLKSRIFEAILKVYQSH